MNKRTLLSTAIAASMSVGSLTALADTVSAPAPVAAPVTTTLMPVMGGTLEANTKPNVFDAGPIGNIYVTGVASGLAMFQSSASDGRYAGFPGSAISSDDRSALGDVSNAQIFLNKADGLVQFFAQIGAYSLPSLGGAYLNASKTNNLYGPLAQGYLKIVPSDNFSIQAGQMSTFIGAENTYTFQNGNIERGLLWSQEHPITRGFQANYGIGPVALSAAWTDGAVSGQMDWVTGMAAWTIDKEDTLTFVGGANAKSGGAQVTNQSLVLNSTGSIFRGINSFVGGINNGGVGTATPLFQNNEQLYNLIYTHASGPWSVTPWLQYTYVPAMANLGFTKSAETLGGSVLVNYTFDKSCSFGGFNLGGYSLPARFEYITSAGGHGTTGQLGSQTNLIYGVGSEAYSLTITPTYQKGIFFARGELSYVGIVDGTTGAMFGKNQRNGQTRGLLEVGFLF